jgi:hypothetical protein
LDSEAELSGIEALSEYHAGGRRDDHTPSILISATSGNEMVGEIACLSNALRKQSD